MKMLMDMKKARVFLDMPLEELIALADKIRRKHVSGKIEPCSIMNAKSGSCSQDCKFCAQSCHYKTGIDTYPLKNVNDIFAAAVRAKEIGAKRFGIVTSGNELSNDELKIIANAVSFIKNRVDIDICASLGKLDKEKLSFLKSAGIKRYHHNIETSPAFFPAITTTHTFKDRLDTIQAVKAAGLEICSGGIIGLGESWSDRIEMAFILKDLDVTAVPINIFVPIKGTPLSEIPLLSAADAVKTIAIFRIILQGKEIKIAAGRESLKDSQITAFMAGANSMLIGGYLTTKGRSINEDKLLIEEVEKAWKI